MSDKLEKNKRIAKNTIALYFRTSVTMLVGLYTGRIMLQALGVNDYGINAVVGGIVAMSSLITGTMSQSISRYFTYILGIGDKATFKTMFSTSVNAQIVIALIATLFLEIVGVWFLNYQANIPYGRIDAANWVLHCSIVSLIIQIVSSPYNALLIAHERMNVFAYIGIIEVVLRLVICFIIMTFSGDRLILLAILQIFVSLLMQLFYGWYCGRSFEEAHYHVRVFDKKLFKELTIFSSWNLLNNGAYVFSTQGVSMLVNVFFGVTFNASRAIAIQANSAIQSFVGNFTIAFSPQITKSYATGDASYAINLANRGTRFTWLMMYIFIVPICMEADTLLQLWLGKVPVYAPLFLRLALFESLAVASGQNLLKLIQADGHMKHYTIHTTLIVGLIFPLSWLLYSLGAPVWTAYLLFIIIFFILNLVRFYDLKCLMTFSISKYMKDCFCPCVFVSISSFILPSLVVLTMEPNIIRFYVNLIISILWTLICCMLFGLTKNERVFFINKIVLILKRNKL